MGEPCEPEPPHGDAMSMGYWPPLPRSNRVGSLIGNDHAKSQGAICTLVGNQRVVNTIIIIYYGRARTPCCSRSLETMAVLFGRGRIHYVD
jgi:hypothetical protein